MVVYELVTYREEVIIMNNLFDITNKRVVVTGVAGVFCGEMAKESAKAIQTVLLTMDSLLERKLLKRKSWE